MHYISKYSSQIALLFVWLIVILLVNPMGDFPLNDDWSYAKSVETLMNDGSLKLYNWGEMTLVGHVYWGYLFTKIFGFSFSVLRWSTLVLGAGSILGINAVCRSIHPSKFLAFVAASLCMFNPIFMSLSFSYMTDVPFFFLSIWGFYGFIKFYQKGQIKYLVLAILFCFWAFFIRQLAFVFPCAWLVSYLISKPINKRNLTIASLPLLSMIILYFTYTLGMQYSGLLQERYNDKLGLLGRTLFSADPKLLVNIPGYFFVSITYLGFFLAPIHWWYLKQNMKQVKFIWILLYSSILFLILLYTGKTIPCLDNILIDFGVGPVTLFDHYGNFTQSPSPNGLKWLWWAISGVGVLLSSVWIIKVSKNFPLLFKKRQIDGIQSFSLFSAIIYLSPFIIVGIYDRYLLFFIPLVLVFLLSKTAIKTHLLFRLSTSLFILLLAVFSICATHDYLSWNRVRWDVLNKLHESGIPLNKIQGGVEFTAWHYYSDENTEWWKEVNNKYILVFNTRPNDIVIETYSYSRWLKGDGTMFLVHPN